MSVNSAMTTETASIAGESLGGGPDWLRGLRSPKIIVGASIVAFFCLLAIFGPLFAPFDPSAVTNDTLQAPSWQHLLGTTQTGQDVMSQMLYGARVSMMVGALSAVAATLLSVLVGLTAGYIGGIGDEFLSLLANIFLVIPGLPLTVIIAGYLPRTGSFGIALVIAITSWAWGARLLRAQTLSLRKRDFVEAARATGEKTSRIIMLDILPNQLAIIAASFLGAVTGGILTQASLAFLGLTDVSEWSWGTILYWAQVSSALLVNAWWWFVPAGLAIALVGTGLSLINFGIDEFINPRLRAVSLGTRRAFKKATARPRGPMFSRRRAGPAAVIPARLSSAGVPSDVVLEITNLTVQYGSGPQATTAVNDVSIALRRGEVLGIAGESGSGKSTLAYAITRLHKPPARITSGQMIYTRSDGTSVDILELTDEELRRFRWEELSIVFQSAMNALNPILTIGTQIDDVLRAHKPGMSASDRRGRIGELLDLVGIQRDRAGAYAHELSGGMRQRAMIAIGLAVDPEVIVMDEPTTALDVVIQRQIIGKIMELKEQLGFSVIFITHDLSLLIELSDTIAIMYAGRLVEVASSEDFYRNPRHPYSQGLLASFPTLTGPRRELSGIPGYPPDLKKLPTGCSFHPRCPMAFEDCSSREPVLFQLSGFDDQRKPEAACLLYEVKD